MNAPSRYQRLLGTVRTQIKEMNSEKLEKRMHQDNDYYLIDVRETHEWHKGRLPNANHMSRGVLEPNIERFIPDPNAEIILYCGGGGRSALAALSLQSMGYTNVTSLAGGFGQWVQEGHPIIQTGAETGLL